MTTQHTDRELMQQALEALEFYYDQHGEKSDARVIAALRERLAQREALDKLVAIDQELGMFEQPVQEPVAWTQPGGPGEYVSMYRDEFHTIPLYTAPQPRQWQGLTEEEFSFGIQMASNTSWMKAAKWVEAKLREKNT